MLFAFWLNKVFGRNIKMKVVLSVLCWSCLLKNQKSSLKSVIKTREFFIFYFFWYIVLITGVSKVMDCSLHAIGQCGYVECKVWELGSPIFRPTVLSPCLLPCKFMERWKSNPKECSSLRTGIRPQYTPSEVEW
jgi:hypothetical protein